MGARSDNSAGAPRPLGPLVRLVALGPIESDEHPCEYGPPTMAEIVALFMTAPDTASCPLAR